MLGHQRVSLVGDVGLQLSFKLADFVSKISNDVLIGADVLGYHLLVGLDAHLDVFRSIGILQSVDGLLILG